MKTNKVDCLLAKTFNSVKFKWWDYILVIIVIGIFMLIFFCWIWRLVCCISAWTSDRETFQTCGLQVYESQFCFLLCSTAHGLDMLLLSAPTPQPSSIHMVLPRSWRPYKDYGATFYAIPFKRITHENQLKNLSLETLPHGQGFYKTTSCQGSRPCRVVNRRIRCPSFVLPPTTWRLSARSWWKSAMRSFCSIP